MEIVESIVLGVIQGIAEWLPVSSEGMNTLIMVNFFGKGLVEAVKYSIWLHLGTLLAAALYFRKDLYKLLKKVPSYDPKKDKLLSFLFLATAITAVLGGSIYVFVLKSIDVEGKLATVFVGALLLITGLLQSLSKKGIKKKKISMVDGVLAGIAQGLAILPGISRSGMTSSVLLLRKYEAEDALRISFLMSVPAVIIAVLGLLFLEGIFFSLSSLLAVLFSFVFGLLTIDILLKLAKRIQFGYFCLFLGVLSILAYFV
jgi:undecaprenyl-diphosphatase